MQRRNILWWASGLILLAIGVLGILHALAFDPRTLREELEKRIEELNAIPGEDVIRKDALAEELLANDSYKEHARALWLKVERAHPRLHDAAKLEREAQKVVPPFLARCKDPANIPPDDLRRSHDEARSHLDNYGSTRLGPPLRGTIQTLKAQLEKQDRVGPPDVVALQRAVLQSCQQGRFAGAMELLAAFRKRAGSGEYSSQLREIEELLQRKAASAAENVIEKARRLDKTAALDLLDRSLPDFRGFQKPTDALERCRLQIKPR